MGVVYEAEQVSLGRRVALKVLSGAMLAEPKHRKRFEREARAAARLHHTNIVPVFGVGEQEGVSYYVMQFIHGQGLDDVLKELKQLRAASLAQVTTSLPKPAPVPASLENAPALSIAASLVSGQFEQTFLLAPSDGDSTDATTAPPISPPQTRSDTAVGALSDTASPRHVQLPGQSEQTSKTNSRSAYWQSIARVGVQVAQALQYAHEQGIIHRDIKPANLLLDLRGSVWVTDFGLAKASDQQDLTHTGDVLGTLRYMAPEQFDGLADPRSDLYSLGLTLYELLALRPAFDEADRQKLIKQVTSATPPRLRSLDPQIPRDLETIVHKAIDRDPAHRYQSAGDMAADLSRYLGDEPIKARRISPLARFRRWCRKNPAVAALTSTIAILITTAAVAASIVAVRFEKLAKDNGKLAGDLQTALGDAERNLKLVQEQEQIAQQNLTLANTEKQRAEEALALATAEQQRAEGNLDLALKAMDAVYLEAIGEQKLFGAGRRDLDSKYILGDITFNEFTPPERTLLDRGLQFYSHFAANNQSTTNTAAARSAQAFYRVALLQGAIEEREVAESNFREAVRRYKLLVENEPANDGHLYNLSNAYFGLATLQQDWTESTELYQAAESAATRAIAIRDTEAQYYQHRAQVKRASGHLVRSLADEEKAVTLAPNDLGILLEAAGAYINSGTQHSNEHRALELCEQALKVNQEGADVHNRMGRVLFYIDQQRALHHFSEALRLRNDSAPAYSGRARVFHSRGEYEKAAADASEAIRLSPQVARASVQTFGLPLVSVRKLHCLVFRKEGFAHDDADVIPLAGAI